MPEAPTLTAEYVVLARALGAAQRRCAQQGAAAATRIAALESELARLCAERGQTLALLGRLIDELAAQRVEALAAVRRPAATVDGTEIAGGDAESCGDDVAVVACSEPIAAVAAGGAPGAIAAAGAGDRFGPNAADRFALSAADRFARSAADWTAADLVICRVGCLTHDDAWRVHEQCRRTGLRCVFIGDAESARVAELRP